MARNMFSGFATAALSAGVVFVGYPVYLTVLGYRTFGVWLVLSTFISVAQLGNAGVSQALIQQIAAASARHDTVAIRRAIYTSLAILVLSGLLLISLATRYREPIVSFVRIPAEEMGTALHLLPAIAIFSVYGLIVDATLCIFSGLGRADITNYLQLSVQVVTQLTSILLTRSHHGLAGLVTATGSSLLTVHIVTFILLKKRGVLGLLRPVIIGWTDLRHLMGFGLQLTGSSVLTLLVNPVSKLLLARYGAVSAVPTYDICYNVAFRVRNLFEPSQRALVPEISRLRAQRTTDALAKEAHLYKSSLRLLLWCTPIYLLVFAAAPSLLQGWLRTNYHPYLVPNLRIMLCGTYVSLLGTPAFYLFLGSRRISQIIISNAVQLTIAVLPLLLIGLSGRALNAESAAISCSTGMLLSSALLLIRQSQIYERRRTAPMATVVGF